MKTLITASLALFALAPAYAANIVDELNQREELSRASEAIVQAELEQDLRNAQNIALFAPNDEAFRRLPEGFVEYVGTAELLTPLLNYHVGEQALSEDDLARAQNVQTRAGEALTVRAVEENLYLNNAQIQETIEADNGVIHIVDRVLISPVLFDREPPAEEEAPEETPEDSGEETPGEAPLPDETPGES